MLSPGHPVYLDSSPADKTFRGLGNALKGNMAARNVHS